jgi:hypothetical protein
VEEKLNAAEVLFVQTGGRLVMVVWGGVVSIIQVKLGGSVSGLFPASVA